MFWIIEESGDCGVHWRRAEHTSAYRHPRVAMLEALEIIKDEWRPPEHAMRQFVHALQDESVAYFWHRAVRVVRVDDAARPSCGRDPTSYPDRR
ncbi:MAG TPA: hypothetical protein VFU43_01000 [Streptosporangiaceae bacterium]|nr:hypothetical protein [Streptosporangiaceae bacterium]